MPLILLTIVFVVFKVTDTIGWSWWWVLAPLLLLAVLRYIAAWNAQKRRGF
jgi:hypothetical protein